MKSKILYLGLSTVLALSLATSLYGDDNQSVIRAGHTYNFAEEDMLDAINEHIETNREKITKKAYEEQEKMKNKAKNFKPEEMLTLSPAEQNVTFNPDMTYTLDKDIMDIEGRVIYSKGFSFNPLKYQKLSYGIVVIDGNNRDEIEWFKKSGFANTIAYRLFLSDGNYYDISQELGQQAFYCLPEITKRFKLQHTPSIVVQKGDTIEVREICIKNCKEVKTK